MISCSLSAQITGYYFDWAMTTFFQVLYNSSFTSYPAIKIDSMWSEVQYHGKKIYVFCSSVNTIVFWSCYLRCWALMILHHRTTCSNICRGICTIFSNFLFLRLLFVNLVCSILLSFVAQWSCEFKKIYLKCRYYVCFIVCYILCSATFLSLPFTY